MLKTQLSENIDRASARAQYNEYCKRILCNRQILARILKETVDELKDCTVEDIAKRYIMGQPEVSGVPLMPGEQPDVDVCAGGEQIIGDGEVDEVPREGVVTFDIRFRVRAPIFNEMLVLYVNLEAQKKYNPGYPLTKRGIFYGARMLSAQYGVEFTGKDYSGLKKVYSIWICMNTPRQYANTIVSYRFAPEVLTGGEGSFLNRLRRHKEDYDLISVVQVLLSEELPEEHRLVRMLGILFSTEIRTQDKKRLLAGEYGLRMDDGMEKEVDAMCNIADLVFEEAMAKGLQQGIEQGMQQGIEQGMQQGIEQGMQQGIEQGMQQAVVKMVQGMLEAKLPYAQIMQISSLSEAEIKKIEQEIPIGQ